MNRLNELKVLKMMDEAHDPSSKGCYTCSSNVSVLIPYDERLLKDPNRETMFKGDHIRSLVAGNDWLEIDSANSKELKYNILLAKQKSSAYSFLVGISESVFSHEYITAFLKHYQRKDDVIRFFMMTEDGVEKVNTPVMMSCNAEWFYLVAPRVEEDYLDRNTPVLHPVRSAQPDKSYIETVLPAPKFNPITGDFE